MPSMFVLRYKENFRILVKILSLLITLTFLDALSQTGIKEQEVETSHKKMLCQNVDLTELALNLIQC